MKRAVLAITLFALSACGQREMLHPLPGKSMPPKAAMAREAPTVDQLITPGAEERPQRSTELMKRSQERTDDPFELPPAH